MIRFQIKLLSEVILLLLVGVSCVSAYDNLTIDGVGATSNSLYQGQLSYLVEGGVPSRVIYGAGGHGWYLTYRGFTNVYVTNVTFYNSGENNNVYAVCEYPGAARCSNVSWQKTVPQNTWTTLDLPEPMRLTQGYMYVPEVGGGWTNIDKILAKGYVASGGVTGTERLKLYMPMNGTKNETSFPDLTNYSRKAIISGNVTIWQANDTFRFNNATYFDGAGDQLDLPYDAATLRDDFSISMWINSTSATSWNSIIGNQNTSSAASLGTWRFGTRTNAGNVLNVIGNGGAALGSASFNVNDGIWHYLVFVKRGTAFNVTVDGVYKINGSFTNATNFGDPRHNMTIGYNSIDNTYYKGYIDDLVIYNYAINPTTIPTSEFLSPSPVTVNFSASSNPSINNTEVQFTDTSEYSYFSPPTAWAWDFGDGNFTGNTTQNPKHLYQALGTYDVTLNVTNSYGSSTSTKSQAVVNYSGWNHQNVWMEGQYNQTFRITDSDTGLPIPVVIITDMSGQTCTTATGTGSLTEPFGVGVVVFTSDGYYGRSISYVFDNDEIHDVQLTPESGEDVSDWAATHNVKFTVRSLFGGPVADVNVTAVYVETTGPLAWLDSWAGVPDAVDIQNTTLSGQTGTDGAIVFLMVESVQYEITAYKAGEVDKSMKIYPKDDYYTIWADVVNKSAMFEHGYNELEQIQIRVNGTEVNTTHGRISVQYIDLLSQTTSATIYVNQSRTVGNVTTETTVASYTSVAAGNFSRDFVLSGTRDQSYTVRCNGTGTVFPVVRRDFGVTFKPGPISFGIPEELLVYVGMVGLIFIALVFVRTLPGPATIVIMFFAWIFYFMGWWKDLGSEVIVVLALIIYSTLAIVFNVMIRSKKRFFE